MKTRQSHFPLDPFAVLGIEPVMEVDLGALERRYVELSRASHPDHHAGEDAESQAEAIRRSAEINDAYRIVRNPWRRAEHLVELHDPGCIERNKILPQPFLMEAMELAEEVEDARDEPAKDALRSRLQGAIDAYLDRIREALTTDRIQDATTAIHEARYYRKALRDIDDHR